MLIVSTFSPPVILLSLIAVLTVCQAMCHVLVSRRCCQSTVKLSTVGQEIQSATLQHGPFVLDVLLYFYTDFITRPTPQRRVFGVIFQWTPDLEECGTEVAEHEDGVLSDVVCYE